MSIQVVLLCVCGVLALGAAQQCNSFGQSYGVQSAGLGLLNGGIGCGSSGLSSGLVGGSSLLSQGNGGALSVVSGSSYAPTGISVLADNLELTGPLAVSGAYPILGAVGFGGNLPTGGQGQVSYSTSSGIGLSSAGCGNGLPSAQPNVGLSGNSGFNGALGSSQLGFNGLSNSGCGCGVNNY